MKNRIRKDFLTASLFFAIFVIFTILLQHCDLDFIAPDGKPVGFAFFNKTVMSCFPVNPFFYQLTEMLGYLAIAMATAFAVLGAIQWYKRKKMALVDKDILCLGILFSLAVCFYLLFQVIEINVRPVLINGKIENSYPSSHTVLSVVVFAGVIPLLQKRFSPIFCSVGEGILSALLILTILGRLLSGVHWVTDLLGGILLSLSLLFFYFGLLEYFEKRQI